MTIMNLTQAQDHLLKKAEWVIKHNLSAAITAFNTFAQLTGQDAVKFPRTINTSNTIELFNSSPSIDGFPAINIFESSNTIKTLDGIESRDHDIVLNISAAEMCDSADVRWASNRARLLATLAADTLETYLKDPYVQGGSIIFTIYRVDTINGAAGGTQPIKGNMMVAAFATQIRVKMRSSYTDDRTLVRTDLVSPAFSPSPYVQSNLEPGELQVQLDAQIVTQPAAPNETSLINYSAADKASSTFFILEPQGFTPGSRVYVTNQNSFTSFTSVTSGGGLVNVLFTSVNFNSGEKITVDVIDSVTKVVGSYTIIFNLVP